VDAPAEAWQDPTAVPDYLRFHVRLLDVDANLWRRFLLVKQATFADPHRAIQDACGWQDSHLFAFQTQDARTSRSGAGADAQILGRGVLPWRLERSGGALTQT
jgi:hypothetical protein